MELDRTCFDCLYAIEICAKDTVAERACWVQIRCVELARDIHFLLLRMSVGLPGCFLAIGS